MGIPIVIILMVAIINRGGCRPIVAVIVFVAVGFLGQATPAAQPARPSVTSNSKYAFPYEYSLFPILPGDANVLRIVCTALNRFFV